MPSLPFHTLDVFTARRFAGNPLAVVLEADRLAAEQMQAIAREFNLSETIFVQTPADAANTAKVRIFFPMGEMPFAGHPTIGCAILLAELRHKPGCAFETEIRLEEAAGLVPVKVTRIGPVPRAMFTAPKLPREAAPAPPAALAAQALGLAEAEIGFDGHRPCVLEGGPGFLYVPVRTRAALGRAKVIEPAWGRLMGCCEGLDAAYLYARGERQARGFRARMFAPGAGIPEDPATGSASAILAGQLAQCEPLGEGTHRFALEQGHEMGRPSKLELELDLAEGRLAAVRVGGAAVRVSSGRIEVDAG